MTRTEFAKGSATFLVVIVAGLFSTTYANQHFAAAAMDRKATATEHPTACVRKDGSWKNWRWSNVPMLSPKCADDR